jgi:hypothetical protein
MEEPPTGGDAELREKVVKYAQLRQTELRKVSRDARHKEEEAATQQPTPMEGAAEEAAEEATEEATEEAAEETAEETAEEATEEAMEEPAEEATAEAMEEVTEDGIVPTNPQTKGVFETKLEPLEALRDRVQKAGFVSSNTPFTLQDLQTLGISLPRSPCLIDFGQARLRTSRLPRSLPRQRRRSVVRTTRR